MRDPLALKIERTLRTPWIFWPAVVVLVIVVVALALLLLPLYRGLLADQFSFTMIVMSLVLLILLGGSAFCILAERKVSAYMQDRVGPNRMGHLGLLQLAADGLKMLLKEDVVPGKTDRPLFLLAPALAFAVAMLGFAVIPWAGDVHWPWMAEGATVSSQVANLDIGFLYIIAVASLSVYAIVLAGYASNNKYSFYGGMRAAAQMISYEIPLGLGLICILLTAGSLRLEAVVADQAGSGYWYIFYHPLAFCLILISAFAETNRLPFDLPEAEQELVAGFNTEYSALKFGMFFLGEYTHMMIGSALLIALFLGGWAPLPFVPLLADNQEWWAGLTKFGVYWAKIAAFIGFYMAIRWTLPRFRFDQLMRMAWKSMAPMGMALVLATMVLVVFDLHRNLLCCLAVNLLVLIVSLVVAGRSRTAVTGRQANLPDIEVRPSSESVS